MKHNLRALVDRYGHLKAEADAYKKQIDVENTKIKALLIENNETEAEGDEYRVKCTAVETSKLNEDKLIETLKGIGFTDCIKTKEYVDIDALESAVYAGKVDAKILADCKETSTSYRLNVYKNKK